MVRGGGSKAAAAEREILVLALLEAVKTPFEFQRIPAARLVYWHLGTPHQDFDLLVKAVEKTLGQPSKATTSSWQNPIIHSLRGRRIRHRQF